MAKRRCPIEMEPRTLNQGQFNLAREVAVDMFGREKGNEASEIFIQGLKAVVGTEAVEIVHNDKANNSTVVDGKEKSTESHEIISETCYQCLCISSIVETPEQINIKEPVSAPF